MSFLNSLFGGSKKEPTPESGLELHLKLLQSLRIPAIALKQSRAERLSRIGGLPSLPQEVAWPEWKGHPLAFLCQIDLSEIPADCDHVGLPSSGMLYFFYSQDQEAGGFDPNDKGAWRVIYARESSLKEVPRTAPQGLKQDCIYRKKSIDLAPIETYPDGQDDRVGDIGLNDRQWDQYFDLCSSVFGGEPAHHLGGYPQPVQNNDMDLECQLVSHGLYCGDASGYRDPKAKALETGKNDWILLLQLDTDNDAGMMWGDCGMLYFWIRKEDLANRHFEQCWMIFQCS